MHPPRRADLALVFLWIAVAGAGVAAVLLSAQWLGRALAEPLQGASADVIAVNLEWLIGSALLFGLVIGGMGCSALGAINRGWRKRAGAAGLEHSA